MRHSPRAHVPRFSGLMIYLKCRMCWQLALAVFLCIVAIEGAILIPSVRSFERDLLLRLEDSSLNALAAVVEIHGSARTSDDLAQFEAAFARATPIRGGILLGEGDTPLARFGEQPSLGNDLRPTSESRVRRFFTGHARTADGTRYDVRWSREYTGLTGDVLMRLDASWIDAELIAFVIRIALLVLMISVFVSGGAMVVLARFILVPMLQVRSAVVAASEDPAQADTFRPNYQRTNELGELVGALNELLMRISRTHREELAMLNAIVAETSVAIVASNEAGELIYANAAALRLFGCQSMSELQVRDLPSFELPDGGKNPPVGLKELLAKQGYVGEATLRTGEGSAFPGLVNAGILTNDRNQPVRYYATIVDISDMRAAQEGLRQRNLELAAAERAKSKFLANMSHEIRTPLNAIIGFSELLGDELGDTAGSKRHRVFVEDIRAAGLHLLGIINDVLDMAKIESGTMNVQLGDVSVADVVDDALRMVSQQLAESRHTLTVDVDKRVEIVRADELKLRQILLNLLSNAIKFTPAGGKITVAAAPFESERLGACLEIVIADTGIGIASDELMKIFEPFSQGAATNRLQLGGTGLGLSLCKALVEAHGGEFAISSKPHAGTRVSFRLPATPALESAA